ncbi:MAG: phosphoenolpyruvate synthase, partial [Patescibacteria group bacterium]
NENKVDRAEKRVLWFKEISSGDVALVGGKNASLGEMFNNLAKENVPVPNGFATSAYAYREFLQTDKLKERIKVALKNLDVSDVKKLAIAGATVRKMILNSDLPASLQTEIKTAYRKLSAEVGQKQVAVAVRSSATAEDLPEASFAGQQETYLNVVGEKEVLVAVKKCVASLFTDRAISYRETKGFDHLEIALSATVQLMVNASAGSSGVMFTLDTESGFPGVVLIDSSYGLGESIVKGRVTPDQFYVFKAGVKKGKQAIISKILGTKETKLVYNRNGGTAYGVVNKAEQNSFSITDKEIIQLAKWGMAIEEYYHKPQDIEWAKDGASGKLYIVQARPETVKFRSDHSVIETYTLKNKSKILLTGTAIGQKIGAGRVKIINTPSKLRDFKKGDILVTRITDPDWEPIMRIASAIITEQGGKTSHAAIVSRELGVPCIVGAAGARGILSPGSPVTVSCAEGDEGNIYQGILPFEVKRVEIKKIPETKTKIMLNVGDPDNAFSLAALPNHGVGLAREEFIFSNFIRIHPLALVHYDKLKDKKAKKQISNLTRGYKKKTDFCVDKLAEGIGRIATAFFPNDVIVRLSDFKTNEYSTLIGGKEFEPKEENPMLGWRGASRYYSKLYKPAFKLECEAIKKAREDWGLDNIIVMVPFCRTPEEGEKVIATMAEYGLKQGENGLKVYVMCEIPSNVILAHEFAKIFDGFSIGSNDLTQLALGLDRDSGTVAGIANENNETVKEMIRQVIKIAHSAKKKIGICGQAPSDYPEFAEFLVTQGIDSISLNPDSVLAMREKIAFNEKTIGKTGRKTSVKMLSIISAMGILGSSLILAGAGCTEILNSTPGEALQKISESEATPAKIREQVTKKITDLKNFELNEGVAVYKFSGFVNYSISYPKGWNIEQWPDGVAFQEEKTGEFVSVFRQLVSYPGTVLKKEVEVIGKKGTQFSVSWDGKKPVTVIEIPLASGETLEINGNADKLDKFLDSLKLSPELGKANPLINQWDIKEKKSCAPMVIYARESKDSECKPHLKSCDVPLSWQVCDGNTN